MGMCGRQLLAGYAGVCAGPSRRCSRKSSHQCTLRRFSGITARKHTVLPSAMHAIHETPCVNLSRLAAHIGLAGSIVSKLEYLSPGFSKKDRIARQMVEEALADGHLQPQQTVIELTSGNTGTGLAIVCAALGHPFVAVMSRGNSMERARMMSALGAEVILVEQCEGSVPGQVSGDDLQRVFDETAKLVVERGAFRADQFELEGNVRAHLEHTGPELISQVKGAGMRLDAFVDFVGSGGTFAGVSAALRAAWVHAKCYVVEPAGAAVLSGRNDALSGLAPHKIQERSHTSCGRRSPSACVEATVSDMQPDSDPATQSRTRI